MGIKRKAKHTLEEKIVAFLFESIKGVESPT